MCAQLHGAPRPAACEELKGCEVHGGWCWKFK